METIVEVAANRQTPLGEGQFPSCFCRGSYSDHCRRMRIGLGRICGWSDASDLTTPLAHSLLSFPVTQLFFFHSLRPALPVQDCWKVLPAGKQTTVSSFPSTQANCETVFLTVKSSCFSHILVFGDFTSL